MPLKTGYGEQVIRDNISTLVHEGKSQSQAVAIAFNYAREFYRRKYPYSAFPHHLKPKRNPRNDVRNRGLERVVMELREGIEELSHENEYAEAKAKRREFADVENVKSTTLHLPDNDVIYELGSLKGVIYAIGDKHYIHEFSDASTPILAASNDGERLYIVGGRFKVTERGIEDMPQKRQSKRKR